MAAMRDIIVWLRSFLEWMAVGGVAGIVGWIYKFDWFSIGEYLHTFTIQAPNFNNKINNLPQILQINHQQNKLWVQCIFHKIFQTSCAIKK